MVNLVIYTKLPLLVKQSEEFKIFFSVLTTDKMEAIQPRHYLWRWRMEGTERDHIQSFLWYGGSFLSKIVLAVS